MYDLIRKGMLTGIGLALKTWDEVEALAKEIEKKSDMPREEGKTFLKDLEKRYSEAQDKLEKRVEKSVNDFLKRADIVTGDELKGLKKEIRELKKMISNQAGK
jgi:polyhydroxyalkanoate synthesis regulator phasin